MITPAEFEDRMADIERKINTQGNGYDEEQGHGDADDLMCAVLRDLGYVKGVEIFERMPKWYA